MDETPSNRHDTIIIVERRTALTPDEIKRIHSMVEGGWDRFAATTKVVGDSGTVRMERIGDGGKHGDV